jgi:hypothetical protein
MSILLTHGYYLSADPKEQKIMKPYPPLGLLYVSAYLNSKITANDVFDSTFYSQQQQSISSLKNSQNASRFTPT